MGRIGGEHLWNLKKNKEELITNFCDALDSLHSISEVDANTDYMIDVYLKKTKSRVEEVQKEIDEELRKAAYAY